jgi:hypothetical protein
MISSLLFCLRLRCSAACEPQIHSVLSLVQTEAASEGIAQEEQEERENET